MNTHDIRLDAEEENLLCRNFEQGWAYDDILWICFEESEHLSCSIPRTEARTLAYSRFET